MSGCSLTDSAAARYRVRCVIWPTQEPAFFYVVPRRADPGMGARKRRAGEGSRRNFDPFRVTWRRQSCRPCRRSFQPAWRAWSYTARGGVPQHPSVPHHSRRQECAAGRQSGKVAPRGSRILFNARRRIGIPCPWSGSKRVFSDPGGPRFLAEVCIQGGQLEAVAGGQSHKVCVGDVSAG